MASLDQVEILGIAVVHKGGYKINLPPKVKEVLKLKEGDEALFYINKEGEVVIRKNAKFRFELR